VNRFQDKVVAATGGAQGIGRATALRFAAEGAHVAVLDVRDDDGERVALECSRVGRPSRFYHCDVTDPAAVAAVPPRRQW
jgi:NAD(P)-dependent dehydrogenase (short-subunit alcohol dehydrogenase family)